jgi:riboflavin synthase
MVTGIIEELGKVVAIEQQPDAVRITIAGPTVVSDLHRGDSIAVSGTCLTAVEFDSNGFTADVMQETLNLTSLSEIKVGDPVNLERAMTAATRFGGHVVQGHVDGVGEVTGIHPGEKWQRVDIKIPPHLMKYLQPQGSICVDGTSLTVGELDDEQNSIAVWLIPETLRKTTLGLLKAGSSVNIEVDVLAKYVERLMKRGDE